MMKKTYGKLALKEQQTIRKYRTVFTSTKGLLKKQKWVILDIDEYGMTYRSEPKHTCEMFSTMYEAIEEITIDGCSFILNIKTKNDPSRVYRIDLKKFDGDLWSNFVKIRDIVTVFAGTKLKEESL
ncbi:hypothetical protein [Streptococcus suis]|uniref:hypothetical protein n=1 Tax=Streptococcus suis TaxID=1307 RepID=UPI002410232B|nr:hypothetical protein [Streptococcus suis]MDG3136244.1 hypothetical protein [Streptococcus suis]